MAEVSGALPRGAAALVSDVKFGGPTTVVTRSVTVGITVTDVLTNNPDRVGFIVMNRSVNNGAVDWNRGVASTTGLLLSSDGGSIAMQAEDDGAVVGYAMFGINAIAEGRWTVIEIVRVTRTEDA